MAYGRAMERKSRWRRWLRRAAAVLAGLLALVLAVVKLRYGLGDPYPDVSTAPVLPGDALSTLVELDLPPGNVTVSPDGRIFFNTHPFTQSHRLADAFLFELVGGQPRPYPDAASQPDLKFVFGMTVDSKGRLWVVSPATLDRERTRLQAFDLASGERVADHELEKGVGRFAQDLRVSPDGETLFLADTGAFRFTSAHILVVSTRDWSARRILEGDPTTQPQDWVIRTHDGPYRIGYGLLTFQVGVDGIALGRDGTWLYFATMSHDTLCRVRVADAMDASLSAAELSKRVEKVARKPLSDGIEVAPDGSVLITDVENGGLARVSPGGELSTLVRDPRIVWADGVTVTPGGEVLFTDSSIPSYIDPLLRPPSVDRLRAGKPYRIYRLRLPDAAAPAR